MKWYRIIETASFHLLAGISNPRAPLVSANEVPILLETVGYGLQNDTQNKIVICMQNDAT